jgi:hypothetical protein
MLVVQAPERGHIPVDRRQHCGIGSVAALKAGGHSAEEGIQAWSPMHPGQCKSFMGARSEDFCSAYAYEFVRSLKPLRCPALQRRPVALTTQFASIFRRVAREKRRHSGALSRLFAGELAEKRREMCGQCNRSPLQHAAFEQLRGGRARTRMDRSLSHLVVAFFIATLGACASAVSPYAVATAGRIGCPAEHIDLSSVHNDDRSPQAWVASCGRTHYACSSNGDPRRPHTRIVCSELGGPRHQRAVSWRR